MCAKGTSVSWKLSACEVTSASSSTRISRVKQIARPVHKYSLEFLTARRRVRGVASYGRWPSTLVRIPVSEVLIIHPAPASESRRDRARTIDRSPVKRPPADRYRTATSCTSRHACAQLIGNSYRASGNHRSLNLLNRDT